MITRRLLGLGTAATVVLSHRASAFEMPGSSQITCRVVRRGSDIGRAFYDFHRQGDTLTVAVTVDLRVKIGFITMFRYAHANTEIWQAGRLMRFSAHTDNNGKPQFATASWNGSALDITGSDTSPYTAPANAIGTSYWNPRTLTDPLVNSQNGKLLDEKITDLGPSAAVTATGPAITANKYQMSGELRMNIWYDADKHLAGLQYYAHDNSILTYERM